MSTALVAAPITTLYQLEEHLQALLDTEGLVPEEQREEYLTALSEAVTATVEKRSRVYKFLRSIEAMQSMCADEVKRLNRRKQALCNVEDRLRDYIKNAITNLSPDAKGKYPRLTCELGSFGVKSKPAKLEIADEAEVPNDYKTAMVTMPWNVWMDIADEIDDEFKGDVKVCSSVDTDAVRKAIQAGERVPGADLVMGDLTLEVR